MAQGAPEAVLIDGYNVLHAIPRFAPRGSDPAPARERFETWVAQEVDRRRVGDCVLVWDGRRGGRRACRSRRLTVLTTAAGVTADERILDLCRGTYAARAASTWVVSSDRDIQGPARQLGFEVLGAMAFYRRWLQSRAGEGERPRVRGSTDDPGAAARPRSSRAEIDELLDAFLDTRGGSAG